MIQQGDTIIVNFYGLTSSKIETEYTITILVNLINVAGEREEIERELSCIIQEEVSPEEGEIQQANFRCILGNLTEHYYSLRVNSSNYINDIPEDEILLDPKLTAEAIERGDLLDYTPTENNIQDTIPSIFTVQNAEPDNCKNDGKLIINGTLSKDVLIDFTFKISLEYPNGIELTCYLLTKEKGTSQILCSVDRDFTDKQIVFEQKSIKDGNTEILIIKSGISTSNITCSNVLLKDA